MPNVESISSTPRKLYRSNSRCNYNYSNCDTYVADEFNVICPSSQGFMNFKLNFVVPQSKKNTVSSSEGGYVKGVVTYMVMDDLVVKREKISILPKA